MAIYEVTIGGALDSGGRPARAAVGQIMTAAETATADACISLLAEIDPDGTWDADDDIADLRAHASDLAVQGYVDECITLEMALGALRSDQ